MDDSADTSTQHPNLSNPLGRSSTGQVNADGEQGEAAFDLRPPVYPRSSLYSRVARLDNPMWRRRIRVENMKTKLLKSAVRVLSTVAVVVFMAWILVAQPSFHRNHTSGTKGDPAKLREHVEALSQRFFPRDWQHRENLDRCADYIAQHFRQAGATVEFQTFDVGKRQSHVNTASRLQ